MTRRYYNHLILLVLFFLIALGDGCFSVKPIYFEDDKLLARKQVEQFHNFYNEGKYAEMRPLFTASERQKVSEEQFFSLLQSLNTKSGSVKISKLIKSDVKVQGAFRVIHMFFETQFEKGKIFEEFDCLVDGENSKINFYGQPENIP